MTHFLILLDSIQKDSIQKETDTNIRMMRLKKNDTNLYLEPVEHLRRSFFAKANC